MSDTPVTVEPDYTKSGIEASETFKNRVSDAGVKYPIDVNGHRVRVKYGFQYDYRNLLKLMEICYYCTQCGEEQSLEGDGLWRYEKVERRAARKYMLGYFVETPCQ